MESGLVGGCLLLSFRIASPPIPSQLPCMVLFMITCKHSPRHPCKHHCNNRCNALNGSGNNWIKEKAEVWEKVTAGLLCSPKICRKMSCKYLLGRLLIYTVQLSVAVSLTFHSHFYNLSAEDTASDDMEGAHVCLCWYNTLFCKMPQDFLFVLHIYIMWLINMSYLGENWSKSQSSY